MKDNMTDKNELDKLNYDKLVLSEEVKSSNGYGLRFLYINEDISYILAKNLENDELEFKLPYNTENITIRDLDNLPEEDNNILYLKNIINSIINKSGTSIPSIEEEVTEITDGFIRSLYNLIDEEDKEESLLQRKKQFLMAFKDENLKKEILKINDKIESKALTDELEEIKENLKNGKANKKVLQQLGNYLNKEEGIILRKTIHDIYKLDKVTNAYKQITLDELVQLMEGLFNEKNLINDNDLDKAIHYITDRLEPEINIVKFNNCLYSMKEHKIIKSEEPIFTLVECPYNYNPEAKGLLIDKFLNESLEVKEDKIIKENGKEIIITKEELTKQKVKGVKQIIGYLFTSGNPLTALFFIVGISGGGKTLFGNLLTSIFGGSEKVSDIKLENLANPNDNHSSSGLVNKHLNLIRDSSYNEISNNGMIKQISGNEDLPINPKNKTPYSLNKDYVPKTIVVTNNIPKFKNIQEALLERFVIIEFNVKFRGTEKEDSELEEKILSNPEEMESLITSSLKEFELMKVNKEDFILRIDENKTLELLLKHSKPLEYIVKMLISKVDEEASYTEEEFGSGVVYTDELNKICLLIAKDKGIQIPINNHGKIEPKQLMKAIKNTFDLFDFVDKEGNSYSTKVKKDIRTGKNKRYYPYLIKSEVYEEYYEKLEGLIKS